MIFIINDNLKILNLIASTTSVLLLFLNVKN